MTLVLSLACAPRVRTWAPPQSTEELDDVAFLHYLATAPVATVDEGARAVLLLIDSSAPTREPSQRLSAMEERGLVRKRWGLAGDHVLDRGVLAYMLARACDVPGGVGSALFGELGDRRDAIRACHEAGLLAYGSPDESISGGELLGAVRAADAWVESRRGE